MGLQILMKAPDSIAQSAGKSQTLNVQEGSAAPLLKVANLGQVSPLWNTKKGMVKMTQTDGIKIPSAKLEVGKRKGESIGACSRRSRQPIFFLDTHGSTCGYPERNTSYKGVVNGCISFGAVAYPVA